MEEKKVKSKDFALKWSVDFILSLETGGASRVTISGARCIKQNNMWNVPARLVSHAAASLMFGTRLVRTQRYVTQAYISKRNRWVSDQLQHLMVLYTSDPNKAFQNEILNFLLLFLISSTCLAKHFWNGWFLGWIGSMNCRLSFLLLLIVTWANIMILSKWPRWVFVTLYLLARPGPRYRRRLT